MDSPKEGCSLSQAKSNKSTVAVSTNRSLYRNLRLKGE